ncbi:glycine cleavage system protein GcvH [bacterium]|nr:glycine cleavage system protein GcvH [bacterium]
MEFPEELRYTRDHEWVSIDGDVATVGITDHAQHELGDVVFVELPAVGEKIERAESLGVVESTKAVSDVFAPISGEVAEVNDGLPGSPELINEDPYGDGWMVKIKLATPLDPAGLMTAAEYRAYLEESSGG